MNEVQTLDQTYHFQLYKRQPITLVRGEGAHVWDEGGRQYLDALAGIAVNNVGHCHPRVVEAIRDQAGKLIHVSNLYTTPPQANLAKRLVDLTSLDRVFFCNSGTEAVEGVIKLVRRYQYLKGKSGKILAMEGCFHGRSLGAISMGKAKYQEGYQPLPEGFQRIPFNNLEALKDTVGEDTLAIFLEPIQGEGGIHIVNSEYIQTARELCDQYGALLVFDEIQCGFGRTGKFLASEHFGVKPDVVTLAKGLGGGFPIGAVLATEDVSKAFTYGSHGTTFGGNALACSAGLAAIDALFEDHLMTKATENGEWFMGRLKEAASVEGAIRE
ncbi:MAG TPA: aspartate aminotransferase family protein, partial [Balneolales bacterium]|nr:aspartate aminotransferase family protein [Balneolales bacterium]